MWVLDHLEDLESDFSVLHRVEDMYSLDGPQFFRKAMRMAAYQGVMAARVAEIQERQNKKGGGGSGEKKSWAQVKRERDGQPDLPPDLIDRVKV